MHLQKKQIRNCSAMYLYSIFQNQPIQIQQMVLYCTGLIHGKKEYRKLILLKCMKFPLKGKHLVHIIGQPAPLLVDSLTTMKKNLGFEDKISFERSTFLLDEVNQQCIRLNIIRHLIQLPLLDGSGLSMFNRSIIIPGIKIESYQNQYSEQQVNTFIAHYKFCSNLLQEEFQLNPSDIWEDK